MKGEKIRELDKVKFWFGENPELVKKFRAEIFKQTGEKILDSCKDDYIVAIFKEKGEFGWTYMPDNDSDYFKNHRYKEMSINKIINTTWKKRLSE